MPVKGEYGQPLALDVLGDAFQFLNSDWIVVGRVWVWKPGRHRLVSEPLVPSAWGC